MPQQSAAAPSRAAPRASLLVSNAHVLSMDEARNEFLPGYVAIRDDVIVGVGPQQACPSGADRVIDAAGKVALPGFVNAHTHAIHILMRGGLSDDRPRYDWLFNVILPGLAVYGRADIELAARLYCMEALLSGITTFVDNVEFPVDRFDMAADTAIGVYRRMGPAGDLRPDVLRLRSARPRAAGGGGPGERARRAAPRRRIRADSSCPGQHRRADPAPSRQC